MAARVTRQQTRAAATVKSESEKLTQTTISKKEPQSKGIVPKRTAKRKISDVAENDSGEEKATKPNRSKASSPSQPKAVAPKKAKEQLASVDDGEKRLRRFRPKAPQSFLQKLQRAQIQRMVVLQRTRSGTEVEPQEDIEVVGSTGNIYTVTIAKLPSCTCPDHRKGNECKHKVYALNTVLKAPENLQYQLAFLTSELRDIFAGAPSIPTDLDSARDTDGKRKPVDGECPICYMDFDEANNELVWCKAACGNNMHKACFDQWTVSQRGVGVLKCVYCRSPWQIDAGDPAQIKKTGSVGEDGYVNVGEHFGMSQARDYSTYHPFWVRRQWRGGS